MDLIKKAETLLFNARKNGKNRVERDFDWSYPPRSPLR